MRLGECEESRVANWVWKAVVCSTMAVFGNGCGRVATPVGDTVLALSVAAIAAGSTRYSLRYALLRSGPSFERVSRTRRTIWVSKSGVSGFCRKAALLRA